LAFRPHRQIVNDHIHHSSFIVGHKLDFATVHKFTADKLTATQVTFSLNQFTSNPCFAFAFIVTFTIREFIHQLTPFDLDPSLTFD
jgi:hypothetical protein